MMVRGTQSACQICPNYVSHHWTTGCDACQVCHDHIFQGRNIVQVFFLYVLDLVHQSRWYNDFWPYYACISIVVCEQRSWVVNSKLFLTSQISKLHLATKGLELRSISMIFQQTCKIQLAEHCHYRTRVERDGCFYLWEGKT